MVVFSAVVYFVVAAGFLYYNRKNGILTSPSSLFVMMQTMIFLGTLPLIDRNSSVDTLYVELFPLLLMCFIVGNIFHDVVMSVPRFFVAEWKKRHLSFVYTPKELWLYLVVIIVVSIFVSAAYTYFVGYNVFLAGMEAVITGQEVRGVALMRVNMYSGPRYFAPGYVNQFKNVLLPACLSYFTIESIINKKKTIFRIVLLVGLYAIAIIFLLATGQRYPLAAAVMVFIVMARLSLRSSLSTKIMAIAGGVFVVFFLLTTLVLGRTNVKTVESSDDLFELAMALPDRLFRSNQQAGVFGFRFVHSRGIVYGREWMRSLLGVLPGQSDTHSLAAEIFRAMSGGKGTAPPTIIGSIWYNFGFAGVVIVPFVLGFVYRKVEVYFCSGEKQLHRVMIYSVVSVVMGTWAAGGPMYMVNNGLLVMIVFAVVYNIWRGVLAALR